MESIYISGPIKGIINPKEIFGDKQRQLEKIGYMVTNPFNLLETGTYEEFMRCDIRALTFCDSIYMMKGWEKSKGANIELKVAQEIGLKILYE
jgi:hypothetical protein